MIVIKDEYLFVIWIRFPANSRVSGAKVTVSSIVRKCDLLGRDLLAAPWPVLSMRGDDYPFLAQRMPSFFPSHIG
jgi:hypothetical protein